MNYSEKDISIEHLISNAINVRVLSTVKRYLDNEAIKKTAKEREEQYDLEFNKWFENFIKTI